MLNYNLKVLVDLYTSPVFRYSDFSTIYYSVKQDTFGKGSKWMSRNCDKMLCMQTKQVGDNYDFGSCATFVFSKLEVVGAFDGFHNWFAQG